MASKKENFLKTKIILLFIFSIFLMLFCSNFINIKFIYFAPFIIFLFYRFDFITILWIAIIVGLIQDLFSSNFFGLNALSYLLTSMLLYKEKFFLNDKIINLSIFTSFFALVFSIFHPLLFFIFDKKMNLSIKWLMTDVILYSIFDGLYAFLFFSIPLLFFEKIRKIELKKLWVKYKKKIFPKLR